MKKIGIWASGNVRIAVRLVITFELMKIIIGMVIGIATPALSGLAINILVSVVSFLALGIWWLNEQFEATAKNKHRFRTSLMLCFSVLTFITSIIAGNRVQSFQPWSTVKAASETHYSIKKEEIKTEEIKPANEQLSKKEIRKINKQLKKAEGSNTAKAGGFALLFVLAMVLTYLGVVLSCGLACSNQAFLAVLTFLLTFGIFTSGFYFLGRILRKSFKPYNQMDQTEKRRERKAWFRTFFGILMLFGLYGILGLLRDLLTAPTP